MFQDSALNSLVIEYRATLLLYLAGIFMLTFETDVERRYSQTNVDSPLISDRHDEINSGGATLLSLIQAEIARDIQLQRGNGPTNTRRS